MFVPAVKESFIQHRIMKKKKHFQKIYECLHDGKAFVIQKLLSHKRTRKVLYLSLSTEIPTYYVAGWQRMHHLPDL